MQPTILTPRELEFLLTAPPTNTDWGVHDRALMRLMYTAGLRSGELAQVRIRDLDFLLNEVHIAVRMHPGRPARTTAGSQDQSCRLPFDDATADALHHYIDTCRAQFHSRDDLLFPGRAGKPLTRQAIWKLFRRYGEKAKIHHPVTPEILLDTREVLLKKS